MIHKLILKNFKKFEDETFEFENFDLIVGTNNSGKSTILQALAIWQYCVEQFRQAKKGGSKGVSIVLPNFTALPVPEFNLLWKDKTDRKYISDDSKGSSGKLQTYILISIDVYWKNANGEEQNFCVKLRYQSPQVVFAIPEPNWDRFKELNDNDALPYIVYVPPFSGLDPHEAYLAEGNMRQSIGKAQPGSVLRNLLYRVVLDEQGNIASTSEWEEITNCINEWFGGIELMLPVYDKFSGTEIIVEYKPTQGNKSYDIISGGSGFHQILTILAFLFGYKKTTTILFDEPDAHLHIKLQRQILDYIKNHPQVQFLVATHSEEFIKNVEPSSIISILSAKPQRIFNDRNQDIISAMSIINNIDIIRTQTSPYILYLEGEDDDRILSAWANVLGKTDIYQKFQPYILGGGSIQHMLKVSAEHYRALKQFVPFLKRVVLVDNDSTPIETSVEINQWKRKNIDSYLLVSSAWIRAINKQWENENERIGAVSTGIFAEEYRNEKEKFIRPYVEIVNDFFTKQGLIYHDSWKRDMLPIFNLFDGKKYLFQSENSLFEQVAKKSDSTIKVNRSSIAASMTKDEIHEDIEKFFDNLTKIVEEPDQKELELN